MFHGKLRSLQYEAVLFSDAREGGCDTERRQSRVPDVPVESNQLSSLTIC